MKMWVANTTKQSHDFIYRLPETPAPRMQQIAIGSQIQISGRSGGELDSSEIDSIIAQHRKYGLIAVDEVDRSKPFIGLVYSTDRPVPIEKLRRALIHNDEVLVERGVETRKEAAIAVNNAIDEQSQGLKAVELSVVEATSGNGPEHKPISEGVRVEPDPTTPAEARAAAKAARAEKKRRGR